jgi:hypothetical protein
MAKQLTRDALPETPLYERDVYGWCLEQARLVRAGRVAELDLANLAEELESLGKEQVRALRSSYRVLLLHLLKWRFQRRRRSRSWAATIVRERDAAQERLRENPGLKPRQRALFAEADRSARKEAAAETGLALETFPQACPFTLEQALDESFWPAP